ncbi:MAG: hypothetical protein GPJ54_08390 [Candidatus Heimdallarchaeota archaeon]|nr:hypothetical protein [Candidatus Heimdallarchaeota archaeon]
MSVTIANPELVDKNLDKGLRKSVAFITWFIILFVPVYSKTETSLRYYGPITEKSYLLPWMIITQYTPKDIFNSDQIAVVSFPWSFILFIPFFYAFKSAWMLYQSNEDRINHSTQIVLASFVQYFLIFMTFKSQDDDTPEKLTTYFIPQILLIIIHGVLALNWFIDEFNPKTKSNKE